MVGLVSLTGAILVPVFLLARKINPRLWAHPALASAMIIALILTLWMVDNLFNDMPQPVFLLMMGGLSGLGKVVVARRVRRPQEEPDEQRAESVPVNI